MDIGYSLHYRKRSTRAYESGVCSDFSPSRYIHGIRGLTSISFLTRYYDSCSQEPTLKPERTRTHDIASSARRVCGVARTERRWNRCSEGRGLARAHAVNNAHVDSSLNNCVFADVPCSPLTCPTPTQPIRLHATIKSTPTTSSSTTITDNLSTFVARHADEPPTSRCIWRWSTSIHNTLAPCHEELKQQQHTTQSMSAARRTSTIIRRRQ